MMVVDEGATVTDATGVGGGVLGPLPPSLPPHEISRPAARAPSTLVRECVMSASDRGGFTGYVAGWSV